MLREIRIKKPDDSNDYYAPVLFRLQKMRQEDNRLTGSTTNSISAHITYDRSKKDPIHDAITKWCYGIFKNRASYETNPTWVLTIEECPFVISKKSGKYDVQGQKLGLKELSSTFARIIYKAVFEKDASKLFSHFYSVLSMPEEVKYCLQNKVPFHYFKDFTKIDVRLNIEQIGESEVAIEVSDNIWGNLSFQELKMYCNFYLHNNKRSKNWAYLSPRKLYERLVGKELSDSSLQVMMAFLEQNRTSKMIEDRANELLLELVKRFPTKLKLGKTDTGLTYMNVRGKGYDWRIVERSGHRQSAIQKVSSFVYQPKEKIMVDEETGENINYVEGTWSGPICIDNMATGSSLGDQIATRALTFMNDDKAVKMVGTLKSYLKDVPDKWRFKYLFSDNK